MKRLFVLRDGTHDVDEVSESCGLSCPDDGMTQQSFADETDINTIVRRFGLTGELPESFVAPQYGDFTDVMDYQTAMNAVVFAREEFMKLPGDVRYRFSNDPQRLVEFIADDRNRDEAFRLGLLKPKVEVTRDGGAAALPVA